MIHLASLAFKYGLHSWVDKQLLLGFSLAFELFLLRYHPFQRHDTYRESDLKLCLSICRQSPIFPQWYLLSKDLIRDRVALPYKLLPAYTAFIAHTYLHICLHALQIWLEQGHYILLDVLLSWADPGLCSSTYMLWFLAFAISAIKFNVLNHLVDNYCVESQRDCFESWTLYFKSPSFPCSPISSYSPNFLYVIPLRMAGWNFLENTAIVSFHSQNVR